MNNKEDGEGGEDGEGNVLKFYPLLPKEGMALSLIPLSPHLLSYFSQDLSKPLSYCISAKVTDHPKAW